MQKLEGIEVEIEGVKVRVPAPYCTPAEWAKRVGLSLEQVLEHLKKGGISKYQPIQRGSLYVNVVQEVKKVLDSMVF